MLFGLSTLSSNHSELKKVLCPRPKTENHVWTKEHDNEGTFDMCRVHPFHDLKLLQLIGELLLKPNKLGFVFTCDS